METFWYRLTQVHQEKWTLKETERKSLLQVQFQIHINNKNLFTNKLSIISEYDTSQVNCLSICHQQALSLSLSILTTIFQVNLG